MNRFNRSFTRSVAAIALALAAIGCRDAVTNAAGPAQEPFGGPKGPSGVPVSIQRIECTANVAALSVSCGDPAPADGRQSNILVGGQNTYVKLQSSNPNYNSGTQQYTFDVTVRNLIAQPLGTTDTLPSLAPDPGGVRVFFLAGPTATAGTGTITVVGDGALSFSGSEPQSYYQYSTVLEQYEVSSPRAWTLNVPSTVETFSFSLLVSAAVPWPNGYIDVMGNPNVRSGEDRTFVGIARNAFGVQDAVAPALVYSSSDTTIAAPVLGTGTMHGLRNGATVVQVVASDGRTGKMALNVAPRRRVWTGAGGTNNWHTGGNWSPDNVVPTASDTAVLSDVLPVPSGVYPVLTQNAQVGGVEVQTGSISLGAFNLTATGDVYTQGTGVIQSSSGRLVLSGIARTVRGTLPRLTVLGTYSLDGNITVNQQIRVQSGRLRNATYRIRQTPF